MGRSFEGLDTEVIKVSAKKVLHTTNTMLYIVLAFVVAFVVLLEVVLGHYFYKIRWSFDNAKLQEEARQNGKTFYHCRECTNKLKEGQPRDPKCATMVAKLCDPSKGWNSEVEMICCSCAEKCECPSGQKHVMNYAPGVPVNKPKTSEKTVSPVPAQKLKKT